MHEVTRILSAIEQGDPHAAEQLLPLVYDELRRLAAEKMAQEKPGQTLQATALVHEAYLRLVDVKKRPALGFSRGHFFAAAAEAMRRILVERARRQEELKHGEAGIAQELICQIAAGHDVQPRTSWPSTSLDGWQADPQAAELVKLRYFVGLTIPGGRSPGHLPPEAPTPLGLRPCLAPPRNRRPIADLPIRAEFRKILCTIARRKDALIIRGSTRASSGGRSP